MHQFRDRTSYLEMTREGQIYIWHHQTEYGRGMQRTPYFDTFFESSSQTKPLC